MSQRNGEKSRFQINRKRGVLRRAKIRELLSSSGGGEATGARQAAKEQAAEHLSQRSRAPARSSPLAERRAPSSSPMHARRFVPGALDVFHVGTRVGVRFGVGARLPPELENAGAQPAQERPVVRYEHHRSLV